MEGEEDVEEDVVIDSIWRSRSLLEVESVVVSLSMSRLLVRLSRGDISYS